MKKKPLNETEIEKLDELLRRAIHNCQFGLVAARPFPRGSDWRRFGFTFNDMLNGPSSYSNELVTCITERLSENGEDADRYELEVFIPARTLKFLNSDQF